MGDLISREEVLSIIDKKIYLYANGRGLLGTYNCGAEGASRIIKEEIIHLKSQPTIPLIDK